MGERGSFVTSYIYCPACLAVVKSVLLGNDKFMDSIELPSWEGEGKVHPIVAGKIGGRGAGGELAVFEDELLPALREKLCHPVTIAVIPETGSPKLFVVDKPFPSPLLMEATDCSSEALTDFMDQATKEFRQTLKHAAIIAVREAKKVEMEVTTDDR